MDEHTSEEERKALAAFPKAKKLKSLREKAPLPPAVARAEDDDLLALLDQLDASVKPIAQLDAFTYWVQAIVAETVYRHSLGPIDHKNDAPALVAEKELYQRAVEGSRSFCFAPPNAQPLLEAHGHPLLPLLRDADVLVTTTLQGAYFYPQGKAAALSSEEELGVAEFLHVVLRPKKYLVAVITLCCMLSNDEYLNKSYAELWSWLVAGNVEVPVEQWPDKSGVPFMDYVRCLWRVHMVAHAVFNEEAAAGAAERH